MKKERTEIFTLGHSPDPDDAFMFYAMAQNKIDLRGYRFEHRLEDIQTLNERAVRGELHISAISIHAYAYVAHKYALLPCGASMGDGYGPIIVRKRPTLNSQLGHVASERTMSYEDAAAREFLIGKKIAVPGTMTSAFLALQLFLGEFDYLVPAHLCQAARCAHDQLDIASLAFVKHPLDGAIEQSGMGEVGDWAIEPQVNARYRRVAERTEVHLDTRK